MMRPTASSAQKTNSKVQTSPPRKPAAPRKAATAKPVKKVAAKPTGVASSSAHPQSSTAEGGRKSSAQEAAPVSEQSETAKEAGDEAALHQVSGEPAIGSSVAVAEPAVNSETAAKDDAPETTA
jgi:hypothetical protein